jgi:3-phosphoshikimate 1-carboxyvinyltransferase
MSFFLVSQAKRIKGEVLLPGDKSIANRAVIISSISPGKTVIENFPPNEDCLYTVKTFKELGIKIKQNRHLKNITVYGNGLYGLKAPKGPVFCGDSGTTMRLTLGILAGQSFSVTLAAGKSLSRRPMLRVAVPLRIMGAIIKSEAACLPPACRTGRDKQPGQKSEEYPPITIKGGNLKPITYRMPVASAQVKSAILLAGLYAEGKTSVIEPLKSRDHSERMLKLFKAGIKVNATTVVIKGDRELVSPGRVFIPGDISSASFFMVLGAILPDSSILIKNVNLNPTRMGIIKVLKRMGADLQVRSQEPEARSWEPMGDLTVKSSNLRPVVVKYNEIPSLIDELPILMVAACFAKGKSVFEGVKELRVKETDRISSMTENLMIMGADLQVANSLTSDKIIIQGKGKLTGAKVKSFGDHRTAMSMIVAGLAAEGSTHIDNVECINKSFPNFLTILKSVIKWSPSGFKP